MCSADDTTVHTLAAGSRGDECLGSDEHRDLSCSIAVNRGTNGDDVVGNDLCHLLFSFVTAFVWIEKYHRPDVNRPNREKKTPTTEIDCDDGANQINARQSSAAALFLLQVRELDSDTDQAILRT